MLELLLIYRNESFRDAIFENLRFSVFEASTIVTQEHMLRAPSANRSAVQHSPAVLERLNTTMRIVRPKIDPLPTCFEYFRNTI
jgi:hypothetical protein